MPIFNSSINNSSVKLINPVAEQIVHSVIQLLGIEAIFEGNIYINNQISTASNYKIEGKSKVAKNRCDVEVVANNNPADNIFATQTARDNETKFNLKRRIIDTQHILLDPVSMIYLHEASAPCSVDLNFKFSVKSIDKMDIISNRMNSVFLNSDDSYHNHSVRMSYTIPDQTLILLHKLWKLKTHSNELKISFPEYLKILSNNMITHEANRDNPNDIAVVICKEAVRIVGRTNNTLGVYETDKTNELTDSFNHTFTYQFVFNKPTVLNTEFPIVIDGAYVPIEYISKGEMADIESLDSRRASLSFDSAEKAQRVVSLTLSYPWIKYPSNDDWVGVNVNFPSFRNRFLPRFSGVCQVDTDKTISLSIPDEIFPILGSLNEVITAAFAITEISEHQHMESLFQIMLFSNDHMIDPKNLDISSTLNLKYENADPTRIYRVVICQQKDITIIHEKYMKLIFEYSWYFVDFIFANLPWFVASNWLEVIKVTGPDQFGLLPKTGKYDHLGKESTGPGKTIIVHNYTLRVKHW